MRSGSTAQRSVAFFFLTDALYWASMYAYVPILAVHAEKLGASMAMVGTVVGAYGFSQLLLRIPLGVLSDRTGRRKPFILAGIATGGIGALGMGLSSDPTSLAFWRAVSGVGAAAWVPFTVLFSSYFAPERSTQAMSYLVFVASGAMAISMFAGGLIADLWGWESPYFVAVALALLGLAAALPLEEKPVAIRRGFSPRELLRVGTTPLLVAVSCIAMLTTWTSFVTAYGFTPVYAAGLGASRADLGSLATVMQVGYTVAALLSSQAADHFGLRATLVGGLAIQAMGAAMVPFVDNLLLVGMSQALSGAGRGLTYPLLMGLSIRSVPSPDRATAMGVFQGIYALGMLAGPATTGFLGDALGLASVFLFSSVVCASGIGLVLARVPAKA